MDRQRFGPLAEKKCLSSKTVAPGSASIVNIPCVILGISEFKTVLIYACENTCPSQNHQTPAEEFCISHEDTGKSSSRHFLMNEDKFMLILKIF